MTDGRRELGEGDHFLRGGGDCGSVIRSIDWSDSVLGPTQTWPASLKTILAMMLHARQPMFLWWGRELIQFYNDAYLPSFGGAGKHPAAMGQCGAECWRETWATLGPHIHDVMECGTPSWSEDQLVSVLRNGRLEDAYWTYGYSPVFDEHGSVAGTLVICQETTSAVLARAEAQWARQQAELSRERLINLVENAPAFVCMFDGPTHVFSMVNPLYQRLVGVERPLIGRPLASALPETAAQGFVALLDDVYQNDRVYHGRETLVRVARQEGAGLEQAYATFVCQPRREADGSVSGIDVFGFDVTEQVQARAVALRAMERNRALFDAIPNQTWVADEAGRIVVVGARTLAYFGVSRSRLLADGWQAFVHPDDLSRSLARWAEALRSEAEYQTKFRLRRADGVYRWHIGRAVPVRDAAGKISEWLGTNTDMYDSREMGDADEWPS